MSTYTTYIFADKQENSCLDTPYLDSYMYGIGGSVREDRRLQEGEETKPE